MNFFYKVTRLLGFSAIGFSFTMFFLMSVWSSAGAKDSALSPYVYLSITSFILGCIFLYFSSNYLSKNRVAVSYSSSRSGIIWLIISLGVANFIFTTFKVSSPLLGCILSVIIILTGFFIFYKKSRIQ